VLPSHGVWVIEAIYYQTIQPTSNSFQRFRLAVAAVSAATTREHVLSWHSCQSVVTCMSGFEGVIHVMTRSILVNKCHK